MHILVSVRNQKSFRKEFKFTYFIERIYLGHLDEFIVVYKGLQESVTVFVAPSFRCRHLDPIILLFNLAEIAKFKLFLTSIGLEITSQV
jgi:hypothetical protein